MPKQTITKYSELLQSPSHVRSGKKKDSRVYDWTYVILCQCKLANPGVQDVRGHVDGCYSSLAMQMCSVVVVAGQEGKEVAEANNNQI